MSTRNRRNRNVPVLSGIAGPEGGRECTSRAYCSVRLKPDTTTKVEMPTSTAPSPAGAVTRAGARRFLTS